MKMPKFLAVVAVLALLLAPAVASAVEYGGVGGTPANPRPDNPRTKSIFVYQLKPGQQFEDGIRIYNNTKQQRTISVYAVDSILASGGAFSCAQQADPKIDVGNWVKLAENQVVVAPGDSQIVLFTVTVPKAAAAGEHDGCITIQDASMTAKPSGQNGVVLGFRSAIRVAITVPGKIVKELSITGVAVSKAKDGSYVVTSVARNNGNVSLDTSVAVNLKSVLGRAVARTQGTYPILAHSSASWNFSFKRPVWGGWYRATTTATYNSNPAAGLGESSGSKTSVHGSSALFFVAPSGVAALVELLILLVIIGFIIWLVKKRLLRRHVQQHWQEYTVKQHQTINKIADQHGVSWKKIAAANKLKPPYHLEKGQKLRLPPKSGG